MSNAVLTLMTVKLECIFNGSHVTRRNLKELDDKILEDAWVQRCDKFLLY
jgi:hypothetical protein